MDSDGFFVTDAPADVIHMVLSEVQRAVNAGRPIDDETLLDIDRQARRAYGGLKNYCAKRTPPETVRGLMKVDSDRGVSTRAIAQTYGISESTVRRYAGK